MRQKQNENEELFNLYKHDLNENIIFIFILLIYLNMIFLHSIPLSVRSSAAQSHAPERSNQLHSSVLISFNHTCPGRMYVTLHSQTEIITTI